MKLLIKIYLEDINIHDLKQILTAINYSITDKKNTFISIISNNENINDIPYGIYLKSINTPELINHKLTDFIWDIVLPITKPVIMNRNFDNIIKNKYKEKFPKFDGVLWIDNGEKSDINEFPVIGRNYYKDFGYIYNPIYYKRNYKEELSDVLKINGRYFLYNVKLFQSLKMTQEDDNIYNLRKNVNFGLIKK